MMKVSLVFILVASLVGFAACKFNWGRDITILDETSVRVEYVAKCFCDEKSVQIARVATAVELVNFMIAIPDKGHGLSKCARSHASMINDLRLILEVQPGAVCNVNSVKLINNFNLRYVSKSPESKAYRKTKGSAVAPPMLANFILHYALEISAKCRQRMIDNLSSNVVVLGERYEGYLPPSEVPVFDKSTRLYMPPPEEEDELLVVSTVQSIDRKFVADGPKLGEVTDLLMAVEPRPTEDHYSLFVKVRSARTMHNNQLMCDQKYRPIYKSLILPVELLADSGFYSKQNLGAETDRYTRRLIRHWYQMTQLCESIRHIGYVSDPSLSEGQSVIISRDEATKFEDYHRQLERLSSRSDEYVRYEPSTRVERPEYLESVRRENIKDMRKVIRANIKARDYMANEAMIKSFQSLKLPAAGLRVSKSVTGTTSRPITFDGVKQMKVEELKNIARTIWRYGKQSLKYIWKFITLQGKIGALVFTFILYAISAVSDYIVLGFHKAFGRFVEQPAGPQILTPNL